ncbi:MAG: hypothetical protein ABR524_14085 [Thermoanaerobaculia bacterium]
MTNASWPGTWSRTHAPAFAKGARADGLPALAVDQARDRVLQLVVAERLRLAEEDRDLRWQLGATVHDFLDGVHEIVHVQEGLAVRRRARVDAAGEVAFVDALDLVR